jgi:hypothetical protein
MINSMSLNHQIDVYCERTDFTFWSEPINAITNIAFIIAGLLAVKLCIPRAGGDLSAQNPQTDANRPPFSRGILDYYAIAMIALLFAIGIGSFLFHTFATRWAGMADVIPMGLIILTFHIANMNRIAGWHPVLAVLSFATYPALGWLVYQLPLDFMGSTKSYLPILPMLLVYYNFHVRAGNAYAKYLIWAFLTFAMSMSTRIMDDHICDIFPYGIHWAWHILNALTLYLAFRAYIHGINKR